MLNLRPYQITMANFMLANPRCNLFVGLGMGKTVATLTALNTLLRTGEQVGPILVLAPLRVCRMVWAQEAKAWLHLQHLRVSVVTGDAKQRAKKLLEDADIFVINYESVAWLVKHFEALEIQWPFTTIVADEVTRLKGFRTRQGSIVGKHLAKVAHRYVTRFYGLTGTPAANGIKDLWPIHWFVDAGKALGKNYTAFTDRWFATDYSGFNYTPHKHSAAEITEAMLPLTLSLRSEDYFDLSKPIINEVAVELPKGAMAMYKAMAKDLFVELSAEVRVDALNAAAKSQKLLQMAQGSLYLDDKTVEHVHDAKMVALEELIERIGEPVLVVYHFVSDLERLKGWFPQAKTIDSASTLDNWNAGKVPVLLVNAASAGHGLSLQHGGRHIVFFTVTFNLEHHEQVIERLGPVRQMQSGYKRNVYIHYLLAKNTIDHAVMERLQGKATVQQTLMKALSNG